QRPQRGGTRARTAEGEDRPVAFVERGAGLVHHLRRHALAPHGNGVIGEPGRLGRGLDLRARRLVGRLVVRTVVDDRDKARRLERRHILRADLPGDADLVVDAFDLHEPPPNAYRSGRVIAVAARPGQSPTSPLRHLSDPALPYLLPR